jgi:hypothetical protein
LSSGDIAVTLHARCVSPITASVVLVGKVKTWATWFEKNAQIPGSRTRCAMLHCRISRRYYCVQWE